MLTFQNSYEQVESLTGDSSTTGTANHKLRWNHAYKLCLIKYNKRATFTKTTVASQQSYELPYNINKVSSVRITVSSIDYPMSEIVNEDQWNMVNSQGTATTSDTPTNYYIKDNNILIYPIPTSSSNTITIEGTLTDKNLSNDDTATTTTVKTLTSGDETVTLNAAGFTSAMVGRFFKVDADGYWYKIASYTSTTEIELEKPFGGTSIAAGTSAFTVAEIPLIPEEYQFAPIEYACWKYFESKRDMSNAEVHRRNWLEIYNNIHPEANYTTSSIVKIGSSRKMKNPNDYWRV